MLDDRQLLRSYAREGSQTAFGELVARHVNLVYSAALRRSGGDEDSAKDVVQLVFTDLARKADSLPRNVVLPAWLHRATRFAAAQMLRTERRRQTREQEAVAMNALESEPARDWAEIRPLLDEALDELGDADRDAVVLRFFEQRSLAQVGQALGATEDAARMRISRALDQLREALVRRGIFTTGTALSSVISANAVHAAPAGLAVTISTAALAATTITTTATATAVKTIAMTTLQKTIIGAALTAAVGTGIYEALQVSRLRNEVQTLHQQSVPLAEQIQQLQRERDDAVSAATQNADELEKLGKDKSELLRLRGEVGLLRRENDELGKLLEENRRWQASLTNAGQNLPVRQRFVPTKPSGNNNASWQNLGPDPFRPGSLWAMGSAGIGDKFPVQEKAHEPLFEVTVIDGDDDHLVVEVSSKEGSQQVELWRDKPVSVQIAERKYELRFPTAQVNPADKTTTDKAHVIVTHRP